MHQFNHVIDHPFDIVDDEFIIPEKICIDTAGEFCPVGPESDAEGGRQITHLLEVEIHIHNSFHCTVFVAADKDTNDLPFSKSGLVQVEEVLHAGRSVKKVLEPG